MKIEQGTRLGPYEIAERVGAGGMGEVWKGRDTRLERDVAVKILPRDELVPGLWFSLDSTSRRSGGQVFGLRSDLRWVDFELSFG